MTIIWPRKLSRSYRDCGYQIFRGVLPAAEIDGIASAARGVSQFEGPLRRQDGNFAVNDFFPNTTLPRNPLLHPHLGLPDPLSPLSSALQSLVTSDALGDLLRGLDGERHYIVHQMILFFATQSTELHLDSWSLDTAPHGCSHTVWIPLHEMDQRSGLPCVIPWPRGKLVSEGALGLEERGDRDDRYENYHRVLRSRLLSDSPEIITALMRPGDCMVWSSLTPHLTLPPQHFPSERLSLQVLIRPARLPWGDFISQPYGPASLQLQRISDYFSIRVMN